MENVGQTHSNADQVEEELTMVQYKNNDDAGIFVEVSGLKETKPAFTPHNPPVDCDPCALRFKGLDRREAAVMVNCVTR